MAETELISLPLLQNQEDLDTNEIKLPFTVIIEEEKGDFDRNYKADFPSILRKFPDRITEKEYGEVIDRVEKILSVTCTEMCDDYDFTCGFWTCGLWWILMPCSLTDRRNNKVRRYLKSINDNKFLAKGLRWDLATAGIKTWLEVFVANKVDGTWSYPDYDTPYRQAVDAMHTFIGGSNIVALIDTKISQN